jgi:hypothetical protein
MEHILKYYHKDHKDVWKCVPFDQIPVDAKYESVLFLQYRAEDIEVSGEEQGYWGPFYLDIDSENIAEALADTREIMQYLDLNYHLDEKDYRLFASGGKGFHIEINPYLYMDAKFKKGLPLRYRAMANRIKQDLGGHLSLDMGVYSQGKGRQWRRVNVQRENGNYKKLLTRAEFNLITAHGVLEVVKTPGAMPLPFEKRKPNPLFKSWFDSTKALAEMAAVTAPVANELLSKIDTPPCVVALANNDKVKSSVNSNLLAMQAISYGLAREWSIDQIISYNRKFINEYRSTQYKTPAVFEDHFRGLYEYAKIAPNKFKFGCKMMLSCVDGIDCNTCEVKTGDDTEDTYNTVIVKKDGYWMMSDNPDNPPRYISNYIIKLKREIHVREPDGTNVEKLEMEFLDPYSGKVLQYVDTTPELFASKNMMLKALTMRCAYYGTDKDLQMLKLAVLHFSNSNVVTEISYTGLKWKDDEWHYVTKEGSMSLSGTLDVVKSKKLASDTSLSELHFEATEPPNVADIISVFNSAINMNVPEVIIPLLGWFVSAFFSPHCMEENQPFPSLFVSGTHGSGKTQTMLQLHRLFAPKRNSFPSISTTTAFSMNAFCSSTNLMPIIFDEFKPRANAGKNGEEGQVSQAIRASYNKAYESRGTASRNIIETPYLAPLAIIGEEQFNEGAIKDRIIGVKMDKATHTPTNKSALDTFKSLPIEVVGAHFLEFVMRIRASEFNQAVARKDEDIKDTLRASAYADRPRANIATILVALDYLEQYLLLYTGDEALVDSLEEKIKLYLSTATTNENKIINQVESLDDVAQVLLILNDLADIMNDALGDNAVHKNRHYKLEGMQLHIDVRACYFAISGYIKKNHLDIYLTDSSSFINQLSQRPYCRYKAHRSTKVSGKDRIIITLDVEVASMHGITLDNFRV